ncbi:M18 family aminopeptidase [Parasporobacterium paucivorans]|uniref:M18 family aminopeptidase n=1 Tax=Parasporobacterium paucivorans DSM 15970 TaxID=1122934 RepID=A0A1M6FSY0_9FIRM|nr:M18 family aminopeptidase [Parasporobacterium paucivorans]SHJ00786.1 aspartyl aminopeptidase [Parasporobacterium paucivorans DSM 15970]
MISLHQLIEKSVSPFHQVRTLIQQLESEGFAERKLNEKWDLKQGDKFFVSPYSSCLFAFAIGEDDAKNCSLRIVSAHTDFPCFKIKPACEISENGYYKLNTEVYGGPLLNTWMDRPLSIAGKAALKSQNPFRPEIRLLDFDRPLLTIPNLAIHLNKDANKGIELNRQKDVLPIADMIKSSVNEKFFTEYLSKELGVEKSEILDFELFVYQYEKGGTIGFEETMYSSPRLDNVTGVHACLHGILNGDRKNGINVAAFFDNEEVGSRTKQGADSGLFEILLEKIYLSLGKNREDMHADVAEGMMLSVDVGHCLHPNYPEKNDITNRVILNKGLIIKYAASQAYAGDCEAGGAVMQLCEKNNIPYQKYLNRSDGSSGSTLGSIFSTNLPIRTMDVGIPLLAMHSARELMGTDDQNSLNRLMQVFFSEE